MRNDDSHTTTFFLISIPPFSSREVKICIEEEGKALVWYKGGFQSEMLARVDVSIQDFQLGFSVFQSWNVKCKYLKVA